MPLRQLPAEDAGLGDESGATDGTNGADASDAPCDPSTRFRDAILVPGLNRDPGNEGRVHLSADERTVYIARGKPWWVSDILVAKRASVAGAFGVAQPVVEINSPFAELSLSLTTDGLTLFVDSDREGTSRIYTAARSKVDEPFGSPIKLVVEAEAEHEIDPYVLPDRGAIYYTSFVAGVHTIKRVPLNGTTAGQPIVVIQPQARWPVVSADELILYFYVDTSPGIGNIRMMSRASRELPFGEPTDLVDLNTPDNEFPQWISPDGCRLYFVRGTANGGYLFVAERVRN